MNYNLNDHNNLLLYLQGIFITSNFDFIYLVFTITAYVMLGTMLVFLLIYLERWQKDSQIALNNLGRLIKLFLKTTFTKPVLPLTENNSWLFDLRLALGSNLLLWIATLFLLSHPISNLAGWFWSWQVVNTMVTIIVWVMRPLINSSIYPYGYFKDLQKILIFVIITTGACLIAVNINSNPGGLLAQQTFVKFRFFNSWNLWANPMGTIAALLVLYLCTITFNTLRMRQRQFEMNYAYALTQKEPALAATLEVLQGFWQLNIISAFVIVFLGGNCDLLHYPIRWFLNDDLSRFVLKMIVVGLVIYIWRQKQVELTTKQWLHFFLKRILTATASVLWLTYLFD